MDFVAPVNVKQQTGQIYATLMHLHLLIHNNKQLEGMPGSHRGPS
jgi:hypothetical protein